MTNNLAPLDLLNLAYPVIPSGGGQSGKAPMINWVEYQTSCPTEQDLEKWESTLHPSLWGIVTGQMSGIVVIDIDRPELKTLFDAVGIAPHTRTPRGGFHYWFRHPGIPVKTMAGVLPGIDIRGDGGFVNVIGQRADGDYQTLIIPTRDTLYSWERLPAPIQEAINTAPIKTPIPQDKGNWVTELMQGVPEGQRDDACTRLAGYYLGHSLHPDIVKSTLYPFADKCSPPLPHDVVDKCVDSITKRDNTVLFTNGDSTYISIYSRDKPHLDTNVTENVTGTVTETVTASTLSRQIEGWVSHTTGWCLTEELDKELGIIEVRDKENRRQVMLRLEEKGIIEKHPRTNRQFRFINKELVEIDYKHVNSSKPLPLKMPLGIETKVNLFPGNLVVVAGTTNAGKTAFLLDLLRLNNTFEMPAYYWYSEGGERELRNRLDNCPGMAIEDWNFRAFSKANNFADVIAPDCLNVVDYLEMTEELYLVNIYLTAIADKLGSGLAVVAIQKKSGAKYGRGQEFSAEKSRLYLSMDEGEGRSTANITIVKGKSWAIKGYNPNGLTATFRMKDGWISEIVEDWHYKSV